MRLAEPGLRARHVEALPKSGRFCHSGASGHFAHAGLLASRSFTVSATQKVPDTVQSQASRPFRLGFIALFRKERIQRSHIKKEIALRKS